MHTTDHLQKNLTQSDIAIVIDDFVQQVLRATGLAYKTHSDPAVEGNRMLQSYRSFLPVMVSVFNGRVGYDFFEPLELFNEAREEIRLVFTGVNFTCPDPDDRDRYLISVTRRPEAFAACYSSVQPISSMTPRPKPLSTSAGT